MHDDATTPEGNLYFAGEHTSLDAGWIHGAVASSLRAVREIVTA
jgi:monoamine oxidase